MEVLFLVLMLLGIVIFLALLLIGICFLAA